MGDPISGMFGGGDKAKAVLNAKATSAKQAAANSQAQQAFTNDYMSRFGQMNGYGQNLSGFYGGQPFQQVAQNYAKLNSFQPKVKRVMTKPDGSSESGGMMDMLDPVGLSKNDPLIGGGGMNKMNPMNSFGNFNPIGSLF